MEILYFGSLCDKEWFNEISGKKALPYQVAQYTFEMALINGLIQRKDISMDIYYLYQEPYYPKGAYLNFKRRKRKLNENLFVNYLSNINLPIIKEFYSFFQGMVLTLKWVIKNWGNKQQVILTPFNYTPLSLGIYITSKVFNIKRVNIFTDLSSEILNSKKRKDMTLLKKITLPLYKKLVNFIEQNYDGYVLFTNPMNNKVNPSNNPYIVIEGIFNNDLDLSKVSKSKAIMYAGTLAIEYGVKNILDAFEQIKDKDLELWIFGDGDMREYINQLAIRDKRVKYFGFKPRAEVFEYEKRASLLINARNPEDEYTRYSFPSKTFEYMVSGTPFLTTNLKCIPEEYHNYLYMIEEHSITSIKNIIEEVLAIPQKELDEFSNRARNYILEYKNSNVQAEKIYSLLKGILN